MNEKEKEKAPGREMLLVDGGWWLLVVGGLNKLGLTEEVQLLYT